MMRLIKWLSIPLVLVLVSILSLLFFLQAPPLLSEVDYSRAVYDEHHHLLRLTLSRDGKYRLLLHLKDISPFVQEATLLQEDRYFRHHTGVNPFSLLRAAWQTYVIGSRRMGASTITMQVARLRYGLNTQTGSGKCWQILRAIQLEMYYSKDQILEAYLNLAPYGSNIEGVGAASLIYFNKSASHLNLHEALSLVVIPQNPTKRNPDKGHLQEVRNKLFARWVERHPPDINLAPMMALPLQMRSIRQTPFLAPHFVNQVLGQGGHQGKQIMTTLDIRLQKMIERIAQHYVARHAHQGVKNSAVLLVDTRDMGVKALLGSVDFFNSAISGQVNGCEAKRSPGSTLKPFIYALALDQGLIHPNTVLKDVPYRFGAYNPENFDNDFVGPIKAKEALILSRNIPAVFLADQLKQPTLYEFLQQADIKDLKSESYYGLALVLGGAEISMQELVSLYAMLANEGELRPLVFTKQISQQSGKRLLSPEASFLVMDMLKDTQLGSQHTMTTSTGHLPIAWKTGTSSGYRDAWTIGIVGPYVLAVWIGNFNNQANANFIGKQIAAPLFFEIVHAMNRQFGPLPSLPTRPDRLHVTQVDFCKASGMLPTRYCKDTEKGWFIPGKSPIKVDTIFREVAIDSRYGWRTCHFDGHTRFEVYEFWPSDLLAIFKRAGIQRRLPPPYDPQCTVNLKTQPALAPQIISPQTQVNYITRIDTAKAAIIPLTAVVDAGVSQVYWFLNATYLGKAKRDQPLWWHAYPGHFTLRVVDDNGLSDARDFTVQVDR